VLALDRALLGSVVGGAAPRTWPKVGIDYARACGDGALSAITMSGLPTPQTAGIGCAAGMAGQGLADAIQWQRNRR
jgi:hypothetical protein